jgi:hypothetical protein
MSVEDRTWHYADARLDANAVEPTMSVNNTATCGGREEFGHLGDACLQ